MSKWTVDKVTDMREMFKGLSNFNQPLTDWITAQVTNMKDMFKVRGLPSHSRISRHRRACAAPCCLARRVAAARE